MFKALIIAGRDLKASLWSIRGAAILFFFLIILGSFFQSFVYTFVEMQNNAPMMTQEAPSLSQLVQALSHNMNFILLLALPAVTMVSFAEERRQKTLRLLQTAPLGVWQMVLGKFFGAFALMGVLLLSSLVYIGYMVGYGNPDPGVIVSAYVGLTLLVAANVSFGIFVSALTSHQFLAFIFTIAGLFFMLILNWIAPNITSQEGVEGFVKYLASTTHLDPFLKGMMSVADVGYFLLVTGLFLFLTHQAIIAEKWR